MLINSPSPMGILTTARSATPTRVDRTKTRAMLTSARGRRTDWGSVSAATSAAPARAAPVTANTVHRKDPADRRPDDDPGLARPRNPSIRAAELIGRYDVGNQCHLGRRRRRESKTLQKAHGHEPLDRQGKQAHQRGPRGHQQTPPHHLAASAPLRQPARRQLAYGLRRQGGADYDPDERVRCAPLAQEQRQDWQQRPDTGARDEDGSDDAVKRSAGLGRRHAGRLKNRSGGFGR